MVSIYEEHHVKNLLSGHHHKNIVQDDSGKQEICVGSSGWLVELSNIKTSSPDLAI